MASENNTFHYSIQNIEELDLPAHKLIQLLPHFPICLLTGDVGAGKTTLIKKLLSLIDPKINATSPTYALIHQYPTHPPIFHIDLYRLQSLDEALEIGIEDILLDPSHWTLIEWPELISPLLPENYLHVHIQGTGQTRQITITLASHIS